MSNHLFDYILTHKQDAILFKTFHLVGEAGDDPFKRNLAIDQLKDMLACLDGDILVEEYTKLVAGIAGVKTATLGKSVREAKEVSRQKEDEQYVAEGKKALPKWVNKERLNIIGFDWKVDTQVPENTGIYFPLSNNWMEKRTNFTIKPIVHINSDDPETNRRITEMNNGYTTNVFELPSKAFISLDAFETLLMDKGRYFLDGLTKGDLNKLKTHYLFQYPPGFELKNLGWQEEGFFAFSNFIYQNGLKKFDEYGLVEVDGIKYLSMGSSNILQNLRKGTDKYKNDKYLAYHESPIKFGEWSQLIKDVYLEKSMMLIAWALLAANRDIVIERTDYCPIPYCFGAAQSGKSQFVASLVALFTRGMKPFNLNQGTEFAFWEYAGRFRNVPAAYNEFDENGIDQKRVKAFKSMADIEGRNKGSGKGNKTETQEPISLPVLLGQYLATMDDGAVLGRTTPEKFVENNNRPAEQIEKFNMLKAIEKKGISSLLVDILQQRDFIAANYAQAYSDVARSLKADFTAEGLTPKNRVLENYTVLLALIKLYEDKLEMQFTYDEFYQYCKDKITGLNNLIGESNSLGEFWKTIERLSDDGFIEPGWDFKVETHTEVKSLIGEKNSKTSISFEKPTRLLFLRLNNVYGTFAIHKRQATGKNAIPYDTIKSYLQEQPYYVGAHAGGNFTSAKQRIKKNTSSMVLNYDMLVANDINLERSETNEDPRELVELKGYLKEDAILKNILNVEKVQFTLFQDESYRNAEGFGVQNHIYTRCFWVNRDMMYALKLGAKVSVTGMLSVTNKGDTQYRNMEVYQVEILEAVPGATAPAAAARFTPTPVAEQLNIPLPGTDEREPEF